MENVTTILTGGTLVTMDDSYTLIHDGAVAIRDEHIVAVGSSAEISARYRAPQVISCAGQIIMPGLVNAHTHVPMTLLRGIADDLRLDVWLMGYIMPTEREFVSPTFCRLGTSLACAEMIRGGVTTFAEMYYFEADIAAATAAAGLRAVLGQTVLKFPAPDAETYDDSLRYAREFIELWRGHPLITPAIAPHAPYSNTEETLRLCTELALEYDVPLIIHLAETKLEVEDHIKAYGQSVIRWAAAIGLFRARVLAAHCVAIDADEIRLLRKHKVAVAHNPSANLKLASGIAPVNTLLKEGVTVSIGTDGPASNNDLDMFEEMRLAALLAKIPAEDPTALPAKRALTLATRMGAQALGLGAITGSLEPGKRADIIVIDAHPTHNVPHFTVSPDAVYSRIVYAGKSTDVAHVLCNGQWLMRDRQLLTLDETALKAEAADYAARISAFLSAREEDLVSKLLAIGGELERSESFEVQVKAVLHNVSMIEELLDHPEMKVIKSIHYRQYDTYFLFDDPKKGRLRYREDDNIDENGVVRSVRSRLTFTSGDKEREYNNTILLSHSRYISDANRPLRFYREYFQPSEERELHKDRRRWHVEYKGVPFFVNVDRVSHPKLPDTYIELKSRTWSSKDAEHKAALIQEMLDILQVPATDILKDEYVEMQES
ncbi:MAG: amidohydrolase family protein [Chloroflexi bacterium]|nr:amidohydrolase family protein [Chloroflexota bacterium]